MVKVKCKGKLVANMLLYVSFPLTRYATWQYSEKIDFKQAYVTPVAGPLLAPGDYLNKLGRSQLGMLDTKY